MRKQPAAGINPEVVHLRGELDRVRRELAKFKRTAAADAVVAADAATAAAAAAEIDDAALAAGMLDGDLAIEPTDDTAGLEETTLEKTMRAAAADAEELAASTPGGYELHDLKRENSDLHQTKQRLSRLYFNQVEENKKRALKLHQIHESISRISSELELDTVLQRVAETIRERLGFRVVLIRLRASWRTTSSCWRSSRAGSGPSVRSAGRSSSAIATS
jgi:hypothetical protein